MASDPFLLKLFDPLKSPVTPQIRRRNEQESPMTALFGGNRSKAGVAGFRRTKEVDLIDLGNNIHAIAESDEDHSYGNTPESTGILVDVPSLEEPSNSEKYDLGIALTIPLPPSPSFDPFSPPSLKSSSSLATGPAPIAPFASQIQFAMSTNFSPVPSNLPYLLHASLSSLRMSSTSDAIRPRRSSIDLGDIEGHMPDASFDILRGELEIGASGDVSFVSLDVGDASKDSVEACLSPPKSLSKKGSPVRRLQGKPEIVTGRNRISQPASTLCSPERTSINRIRTISDAPKVGGRVLQTQASPPSAPFPKAPGSVSPRRPTTVNRPRTSTLPSTLKAPLPLASPRHKRTISITSVGSATTIGVMSPERRKARQTEVSPIRRTPVLSLTARSRPSLVSKPTNPRTSTVLPSTNTARALNGPRPSVVSTSRASIAPRPSTAFRSDVASTPEISRTRPGMTSRPSMAARTAATPRIVPGRRDSVLPAAQSRLRQTGASVLTPGVRSNLAGRSARPSAILESPTKVIDKSMATPEAPTMASRLRTRVATSGRSSIAPAMTQRAAIAKTPSARPLRPRPSSVDISSRVSLAGAGSKVGNTRTTATGISRPASALSRAQTPALSRTGKY